MLPGQLTDVVRLRIVTLTVGVALELSESADGDAEAMKGAEDAAEAVGTKRIQLSWISPMKSSVGVLPVRSWFIVSRRVLTPARVKVWRFPAASVRSEEHT